MLEPSVPCPPLEAVWEEYQKPVNIEDEVLGTLKLNRDFGLLDGKILWNEKEVSLALEIDLEDEETWDTVRSIANDDEKKNADPITEEEFAQRVTLSELSLTYEGDFTAYFDDDDMFWGHTVEVCGSLENGIESANIAG